MNKIELYNSILSDIGNLVLVILGFSISLFTVLYSFIIAKREQLREYSDRIKEGNKELLVIQRQSNAIKYVNKFKAFNTHLILTVFANVIIYVSSIILKYLVSDQLLKERWTWIVGIFTTVILIYMIIMLLIALKDYLSVTKT